MESWPKEIMIDICNKQGIFFSMLNFEKKNEMNVEFYRKKSNWCNRWWPHQYFTVKAETYFIQPFLVSTCHKSWRQLNIKMQFRESCFTRGCDNVVKVMETSCGLASSEERTSTVQQRVNEQLICCQPFPVTCLHVVRIIQGN